MAKDGRGWQRDGGNSGGKGVLKGRGTMVWKEEGK